METHELKTILSRWMKSIKHHTINGQTHIYRPFISTGSAIFDLILDEKVLKKSQMNMNPWRCLIEAPPTEKDTQFTFTSFISWQFWG